MSWHDTRHAAGTSRNRVADAELTLGPGTYEAVLVAVPLG